jgi:hypothetical protein
MQKHGIFGEVRLENGDGYAVVAGKFYECEFSERENWAELIMCWCRDRDNNCREVILLDYATNKEVGRYGPDHGKKKPGNLGGLVMH